jgi:hypothetical protein
MVALADAPYIGAQGGKININGVEVHTGNTIDVNAFFPQGPNRGGKFVMTDPGAPPLGALGGNPPPNLPPVGSPLSTGYRVIVEPGGLGEVRLVTMFPQ